MVCIIGEDDTTYTVKEARYDCVVKECKYSAICFSVVWKCSLIWKILELVIAWFRSYLDLEFHSPESETITFGSLWAERLYKLEGFDYRRAQKITWDDCKMMPVKVWIFLIHLLYIGGNNWKHISLYNHFTVESFV